MDRVRHSDRSGKDLFRRLRLPLTQFVYSSAVLNESLRLLGPVHSTTRMGDDPISVGKHVIPAGAKGSDSAQCRCQKAITSISNVPPTSGTPIVLSILNIHQSPVLWDRPDEFRPERFLQPVSGFLNPADYYSISTPCTVTLFSQDRDVINPNSFVPFGAGSRMCIGHKFALLVSSDAVSTISSKALSF